MSSPEKSSLYNLSNRSFRLRGTRITEAQAKATDLFWDQFGIVPDHPIIPSEIFPTSKKVIMEIGTGMGEATAEIARNFPETGFLAVDVHRPGVGKLFALIHEYGLKNLRVIQGDAHLIVHDMIANGSLDGIHLFFPDPWPKKRHLKRRIFQAPLLDALTRAMSAHGRLLVATDVADYAQWMLDQAAGAPQWRAFCLS